MTDDAHLTAQIPHLRQVEWLRTCTADAFTEVQRADTKAMAVCGVAGGLLAAGVAVVPQVQGRSLILMSVLALTSALLAAALGVAVSAIRPALPRTGLRTALSGGTTAEVARQLSALAAQTGAGTEREAQVRRLLVLTALADHKFRTVRFAVDLVISAMIVAGIGLLITCMLL